MSKNQRIKFQICLIIAGLLIMLADLMSARDTVNSGGDPSFMILMASMVITSIIVSIYRLIKIIKDKD